MNDMFQYDVFLSYNYQDSEFVKQLAGRLVDQAGLRVFLDEWELVPGTARQEEIEKALAQSRTYAVCLGHVGLGDWQNEEARVALQSRVSDKQRRVIPVLLPGSDLHARGCCHRSCRDSVGLTFAEEWRTTSPFAGLWLGSWAPLRVALSRHPTSLMARFEGPGSTSALCRATRLQSSACPTICNVITSARGRWSAVCGPPPKRLTLCRLRLPPRTFAWYWCPRRRIKFSPGEGLAVNSGSHSSRAASISLSLPRGQLPSASHLVGTRLSGRID